MNTHLPTPITSLGPTDIRISALGVGTWAWGDRMVWQYGRDEYTDRDLEAAYQVSLAHGVNFFDTAEVYGQGRSERLLGRFARAARWPVVIATKCFPFPWRWHKGTLTGALNASLGRLNMPRVDLYQLHWPWPPVPIEAWMDAMAEVAQAGLVRAVGVSNYSVDQTRRAHDSLARRGVPLASNQVKYSLIHRKPEHSGLLEACRDLNITLIAYSPLGQGLLTGKYTPRKPPPGVRGVLYRSGLVARIQPLIGLMREIGQGHGGRTPAQIALNWTICKGTVPIVGAKNARQALENVGAMGWRLSHDEVLALDSASAQLS